MIGQVDEIVAVVVSFAESVQLRLWRADASVKVHCLAGNHVMKVDQALFEGSAVAYTL